MRHHNPLQPDEEILYFPVHDAGQLAILQVEHRVSDLRGLVASLSKGRGVISFNNYSAKTSCILRYSFPMGGTNIISVGDRDFDARRFR
jgi:hypothetical protein